MRPRCLLCDRKHSFRYRIDRHHVTYNPPKIVYLCRPCHQLIHLLGLEKDMERAQKILEVAQGVLGYAATSKDLIAEWFVTWLNLHRIRFFNSDGTERNIQEIIQSSSEILHT